MHNVNGVAVYRSFEIVQVAKKRGTYIHVDSFPAMWDDVTINGGLIQACPNNRIHTNLSKLYQAFICIKPQENGKQVLK